MRRGPACVLVVRRDRRDRSDRRRVMIKNEVCVSKLPFERVTSLEKKAEHETRGKRERIECGRIHPNLLRIEEGQHPPIQYNKYNTNTNCLSSRFGRLDPSHLDRGLIVAC